MPSSSSASSSEAVHSHHVNSSWQDKGTPRHAKKVVVIGAGPAGVHAAAHLRAQGFTDISIFEAGCAVGGRCVSRVMHEGSVPVEAGFLANIVSEARNPLAELMREYGLVDQEVEVGNSCPAISREEEAEESHEDDNDCGSRFAIKVKRFSNPDNLEADDANDVDDDDGLPRGLSTSTTTPLPHPASASSSSSGSRNPAPPLPHFRGNPPAVLASGTSPPTPRSPSGSIPAGTPKHTSPTPSSSSPHPPSSSPSSPRSATASTEFKRSMSSLTGQIREASLSEMPPLRRFLNRGISSIKDHVGHFLGGEPLVAAARRYTRLHKQLLGEYPLGMPPRPKNEQLGELNKNFVELLKQHDLLSLIPVFVLCPVVFSYHFLEEVPALYGLWWYHPERVTALIDFRKGTLVLPRYTVLKCGWQTLWARMVEAEGLDVHLNAKVKSIRRPGIGIRGQIVVGGGGGGGGGGEQAGGNAVAPNEQETHEFDLLVLACSLQSVLPLLLDATEEEQELVGALTEFTLCSTIFEADPIMGERPVELYPFPKRGAATGQVFAQVNPRLLVRTPVAAAAAGSPRDEQQQVSSNDDNEARLHSGSSSSSSSSATKDPRIVYQFIDHAPKPADVVMLTRRLKMYFDDQSFHELTILKQCLWRFFPHFSNKALIKGGWLWRLQEMQGQQGTLYLGASACMDALNEVLLYNEVVLEQVLGL